MKTRSRHSLVLLAALTLLAVGAPASARAQAGNDVLQVVRESVALDRMSVHASRLELTEQESPAFWAVYRDYRAEVEKIGDALIKLVLEYADVYPAPLDEARAARMVKQFTGLEERWAAAKARCARKLGRTLPASKVLRFLQLENRLDLNLRLQLASAVPLVPVGETP